MFLFCGSAGNRTQNLFVKSELLYQLSYRPKFFGEIIVTRLFFFGKIGLLRPDKSGLAMTLYLPHNAKRCLFR